MSKGMQLLLYLKSKAQTKYLWELKANLNLEILGITCDNPFYASYI